MGQSSDAIRQEIDQKRADAASKIDQFQTQMEDTSEQLRNQVKEGAEQVQATAEHVREQVQGTVEDTVETAKQTIENIDFKQQVQQRPLLSVGAAFFGGMMLGKLTNGHDNGQHSHSSFQQPYQQQSASSHATHQSNGLVEGVRGAVQKSGIEDLISNATAALIGQVADQARTTIDRSFPGFSEKVQTVQQQDGSVIDKAKASMQPE